MKQANLVYQMQRPNVTNGCNDGMQCKMSGRCCRFAWLQKQKGFETQVPALLVLASATNDETQVPAFKLAAWRQETMSEK